MWNLLYVIILPVKPNITVIYIVYIPTYIKMDLVWVDYMNIGGSVQFYDIGTHVV